MHLLHMHLGLVCKTHKLAVDYLILRQKSIFGKILNLNALQNIVLVSIHSP